MKKDFRIEVARVIDQIGTKARQTYYIQGVGDDEDACILDARQRGQRYCERYGWEEFKLKLTLGDLEKLRAYEHEARFNAEEIPDEEI